MYIKHQIPCIWNPRKTQSNSGHEILDNPTRSFSFLTNETPDAAPVHQGVFQTSFAPVVFTSPRSVPKRGPIRFIISSFGPGTINKLQKIETGKY